MGSHLARRCLLLAAVVIVGGCASVLGPQASQPLDVEGLLIRRQSPAGMTMGMVAGLRGTVHRCWDAPLDQPNAERLVVRVRARLSEHGTLIGPPQPLNRRAGPEDDPAYRVAVERAVDAVVECQPYDDFLPSAAYEQWKEIEITFRPSLSVATDRAYQEQLLMEAVVADQTTLMARFVMTRVYSCWRAPVDSPALDTLLVSVSFELNPQGELVDSPVVLPGPRRDSFYERAVEAAVQAVVECQPYDFLPADRYDEWKHVTLNFDPVSLVERAWTR